MVFFYEKEPKLLEGSRQGKYKLILEHSVAVESKEVHHTKNDEIIIERHGRDS